MILQDVEHVQAFSALRGSDVDSHCGQAGDEKPVIKEGPSGVEVCQRGGDNRRRKYDWNTTIRPGSEAWTMIVTVLKDTIHTWKRRHRDWRRSGILSNRPGGDLHSTWLMRDIVSQLWSHERTKTGKKSGQVRRPFSVTNAAGRP
jgi:hypothetical protein